MKARFRLIAGGLVLVAVASCVELTGQRITMRYDEPKDELQILFCHDGIHESPPSRNAEGSKQIPEFVANGDLLLLDWPGYVSMKEARNWGDDSSPALRAVGAAAAASIRSTAIGRYRDPAGRVGAAQLVVISHAKDFVAKINAAISEAILNKSSSADPAWAVTTTRMLEGARQGRAWLAIEGHSLRFRFPANPSEWARGKAAFVKAMFDAWKEANEGKSNDTRPEFIVQFLALSPLSIEESSDGVSIRIGDPQRPLSLRFAIRDAYNSQLEPSVAAAAPAELDEALARRLLGPAGTIPDHGIEALVAWGPPEDSVRALLGRAASSDAQARAPAIERLRKLGDAWNQASSLPRSPEFDADASRYLAAWREWYRAVLAFPTAE